MENEGREAFGVVKELGEGREREKEETEVALMKDSVL